MKRRQKRLQIFNLLWGCWKPWSLLNYCNKTYVDSSVIGFWDHVLYCQQHVCSCPLWRFLWSIIFWFWNLKTWVQVPVLPLAKNVVYGYTPNFSELPFSHLKIRIIVILPTLCDFCSILRCISELINRWPFYI